jgi:hypothetical protein
LLLCRGAAKQPASFLVVALLVAWVKRPSQPGPRRRRAGASLLLARGSSAKPEFERLALPAAGAAAAEIHLEPRLVRHT